MILCLGTDPKTPRGVVGASLGSMFRALATLLLLGSPALAAPHMVADLYSGKAGLPLAPQPSAGFEHEGVSYFPATDAQHGYELWRTDGTADGTYRLTDVCPGACSSGARALPLFHDGIYFTANDGEHGDSLWRTDGVPGHEERVAGLCEGSCLSGLEQALPWRNALWFLTPGPGRARALWTSDLTADGTHEMASFCTGLGICGFGASAYAFLGGSDPSGQGLLLWIYTDAENLFRTDGTAKGTVLLHRFKGASSARSPFAARSGQRARAEAKPEAVGVPIFFLDGTDLWTSDGTPAGTHLVSSLESLLTAPSITFLQSERVIDGVWYGFFAFGDWLRSDGTPAGTVLLAHRPDDFDPIVTHVGSDVLVVTVTGLWRAGATAETTIKVFDWQVKNVLSVVEQLRRVFIVLWNRGGTVWTTDGTAAGTHHVKLPPGQPVDAYETTAFAGGVLMTRGGDQLWSIDATGAIATQLHDFQPVDGPSLSEGGAVLGGRLLFYARSTSMNASLFSSDGTAAGTGVIASEPNEGFDDHLFTRFGSRVLFNNASALWVTDGSAHGTRPLGKRHDYAFPYRYSPVAEIDDRLVFAGQPVYGPAACSLGQDEPWITDGFPRHTTQIADLNPYFYSGGGSQCDHVPFSSNPGPGISFGSIVLFAADDLVHGRELFVTDGTAAGTRLVADINPKTVPNTVTNPPGIPPRVGLSSAPSDFVALGSRVVFVADDGTSGRELWITNGTTRGTRRIVDLRPGSEGSMPHDLVTFNGSVYFIARNGEAEGLFRTDGTVQGTVLVSDLELAGQPTRARTLTVVGGKLFFAAFNESTGTELWTSEGTASSTHLVVDLRPGARGSAPQNFKAVRGVLVFAADDGQSGLEPWRSDGTLSGTFQLGDIAAGDASSNPGLFRVVGDQLLFGADDGEHGRELWALPIADLLGDAAPR